MKSNFRTLFLLVLPLMLPIIVAAQTHRASLRGTIYDEKLSTIAGATITLKSLATGEIRTTTSGESGEYTIASIQPGLYELEIEMTGFAKRSQRLDLLVNEERRHDVTLNIGTLHPYEIDSTFEANLKKDTASLGTVIENRQVTGLPLDGRNFFELSLLVPGAVPPAQGSAGSVRGDFSFSVNGAREDANNFLLDGVYNIDPKLNTFGVRPSVDAIREFEMLTSTYDASFGRNPGAQVNVILKSGANDFHGSLFTFHRNAALDARNFFAPASEPKPKYIRNQFGGAVGGPISRDKLFFFADYEGTRSREGITRITNVPTALERAGNFSQSLFGVPINPFTGLPFDNGIIPDVAINPVGRAIAALYPLPNRNVPFQNFVSS
ncbi:MAG TPA: carboxypeptidase-like regulatory domain-containing protein, partial [Pyrinomonadaceae bacterium]